MNVYKAPIRDLLFALEAFDYSERVASLEEFRDFDIETVEAILQSGADVLTKELLPLNRVGDEEGLKWDPQTGEVTMPTGFRDAYRMLVREGMIGITGPAQYGGGGGPESLSTTLGEISTATNKSFSMAPGLTRGLVDALLHHATEAQKDKYLPKLVSGEWSGTMCLTEPQCGTDLGLVRSKATAEGDHFRISGTKIWISFGEHDMSDNIIHFVLARLPDAPEGIKGLSVFIVPKLLDDGATNGVMCTGLEHKMGIKASPTCVIELDNSIGYLVGKPHKGMRAMFTMMNVARLHVGMEGIALGEIAYQTAVAFAKDRRQMRALDSEKSEFDQPADCIMVHPDIRRQLLNIKATTEAMRALAVWGAVEHDVSTYHPDAAVRQEADDLVQLLTPLIKAYCTERGFFNISDAMQVCGGAGYTTDWDIEQYMRDERIALIYEGTNHIQALDLVGRKLPRHGGRLFQVFSARITSLIRSSADEPKMSEFLAPLKAISKQTTGVTMELAGRAMEDNEVAGAVGTNYLTLLSLCALTYAMAVEARHALANPGPHSDTKLKTVRWFNDMVLPEADSLVRKVAAGKGNMFDFDVDEF